MLYTLECKVYTLHVCLQQKYICLQFYETYYVVIVSIELLLNYEANKISL